MKHILRVIALLLAVLTLMTACTTPTTPPEVTTDSTETTDSSTTESTTDPEEAPPRETYEDLSHNVPEIKGADGKSSTVVAEGERVAPDVTLVFNGESGVFAVSSALAVELHDSNSCEECGYVEGKEGYFLSTHGQTNGQAGITVTLASPIPISTVTGMTVTYRSSKELSTSVFRILSSDSATTATFHNECPTLAGASQEFRTVDVNMTNIGKLDDGDGNLSAFQLMFRNKENASVEIKEVTVCVNPEKLLVIDELEGNYFSRGDVTAAIAATIAERFTTAKVGAEITVTVDQYRQNNTKMDGSIRYDATAKLNDGSSITTQSKVTIPHVSGVWLDATDGRFGASHDNLGQWQETFDPSGMVLLTGNTMDAKEGIITSEYALIPESGSYDDATVIWRKPHILKQDGGRILTLFVNGWLDYAGDLTEGQRYRLLVRGVTDNDNYILHLDIPFTYSPLDASVTDKLISAMNTVASPDLICSADTPDKDAYIAHLLTELLDDPTLEVRAELLGEGVNSVTVKVSVLSKAAVTAQRLPVYTVDGETLNSVFAFTGEALTGDALTVPFDKYEGSILLQTPYDGDTNVILASSDVVEQWNASIAFMESGKYKVKHGEFCLPVPAELTWTDTKGGDKTYTVTLSKNRDLSQPIVLSASECRVSVSNLEMGRQYYWQVSDGESTSQLFTFTTAYYPRFFGLEGISNFRDLGGYKTTDGKRVKQNMVFRSAYLNDGSTAAKDFIVNELGLKCELDLRGSGAACLGSTVKRRVIGMQWYTHIYNEKNYETTRQTIAAFADPNNYPMNFHCAVGRDRTGTTAFLILGLLGVDEETVVHEFYTSFLSETGTDDIDEPDEFKSHNANINSLISGLAAYSSASLPLQERVEAYLLRIGVTEEEMNAIRDILLED